MEPWGWGAQHHPLQGSGLEVKSPFMHFCRCQAMAPCPTLSPCHPSVPASARHSKRLCPVIWGIMPFAHPLIAAWLAWRGLPDCIHSDNHLLHRVSPTAEVGAAMVEPCPFHGSSTGTVNLHCEGRRRRLHLCIRAPRSSQLCTKRIEGEGVRARETDRQWGRGEEWGMKRVGKYGMNGTGG